MYQIPIPLVCEVWQKFKTEIDIQIKELYIICKNAYIQNIGNTHDNTVKNQKQKLWSS
jgi:hypothetical protein